MHNFTQQHLGRGFTLIELLVVVSIIGLLSSVIITSLSQARVKASNAAIAQQMNALRTEAALIHAGTGSYNTLCANGSKSALIFTESIAESSQNPVGFTGMCLSSGTNAITYIAGTLAYGSKLVSPGQWAAVVQSKDGRYYCTDYTGIGRFQVARGIDTGGPDVSCD